MEIRPITIPEYDHVREEIVDFWDSDRTQAMHQTMYLHEFGESCLAAVEGDRVLGYLVGFASQSRPAGYIHLVGVRRAARGRGVARALYEHFARWAAERGCTYLRAITSPTNTESIAFHRALGFSLEGDAEQEGVPVVSDYGGPGVHRVVFRRPLGSS